MALEGTPKEALAAAAAQAKQAEAAMELARTQLANARITAPIGGLVSSLAVEVGGMVAAGVPVAGIVDIDTVEVSGTLPQGLVNSVAPGQVLAVEVPAVGRRIEAAVGAVSPAADPRTRGFLFKIPLPNLDHVLKPGMVAEVSVVKGESTGALLVPQEAIVDREDGGEAVFVVNDGRAALRTVVVGLKDGTRAEILKGLSEGDPVVVAGQHFLEDGEPVAVAGK